MPRGSTNERGTAGEPAANERPTVGERLPGGELLGLREAGQRYGISRNTLLAAAKRGGLTARKIGTQWVTTGGAIEHWRRHGKHVPGPVPKRGRVTRRRVSPSVD